MRSIRKPPTNRRPAKGSVERFAHIHAALVLALPLMFDGVENGPLDCMEEARDFK